MCFRFLSFPGLDYLAFSVAATYSMPQYCSSTPLQLPVGVVVIVQEVGGGTDQVVAHPPLWKQAQTCHL